MNITIWIGKLNCTPDIFLALGGGGEGGGKWHKWGNKLGWWQCDMTMIAHPYWNGDDNDDNDYDDELTLRKQQ